MNKYLSSKIKIVSFIAIILVVFTHCYSFLDNFLTTTTIITEGLNYGTFIEYFICNGFSRFAVPLFFMISGYLFYLSFKCSLSGYLYKVKSRFFSLAIPYILWTLISVAVCLIFWNVDIMPVNDMKTNMEAGGMLAVFLSPPNFQFWFVKQLIIYVVLSPIIYLLLRFRVTRIVYLLAMLYLWATDVGGILCGQVVVEALFFYSLGAYLSITDKKDMILKEKSKTTVILTLVLWIAALTVKTVLCGILDLEASTTVILALYKICVILGIFTVWFGADYVLKKDGLDEKILKFAPHTFFIFCFHEPLLDFVVQTSMSFSQNTLFSTVTYFIYPTVAIILAIAISKLLIRYLPFIHNVLTGSRGTKK